MVPKVLLIAIFGVHQITIAHQQYLVTLPDTIVTENILKGPVVVKNEHQHQQRQQQQQIQHNEESKQVPLTFRYGYAIIGQNDSVDQRSEYQWGQNRLGNYFVQLPDGQSKSTVEYTADNLGFHPVVRFEMKNNQSELTSHFAMGENAVKLLNNENGANITESPIINNINAINNKSNIESDNISFSIKCTITSSSKDKITSLITKKSDDGNFNGNQENCKHTHSNNDDPNGYFGNETSTFELNPITDTEINDNPSEEDDSMFSFNKSFGDIFKNRITEYLSNASKSHPEIFKTSKAVPHMNEVFHYFDVHPASEIESDYRNNKTYSANDNKQNNYQTQEDFNTYQSVSGLDNWITEYLERTKPPEIYSNYDKDLQAQPTHVSKIKSDNSTTSITKKNISDGDLVVDKPKENKNPSNHTSRDVVSDFTGFISDEDVININDAAEEYIATAESQKQNQTIAFLPTVNTILENFKEFDEILIPKNSSTTNHTFYSPIIVNDNYGLSNNSTQEYLEDNAIADSNAVHSNTYLNQPNEVQIIQSREKFINIPRSESTKQINVEILKDRITPVKKLFVPAKELDESHENEERNFSKEYLGTVEEAPSRRFLKNFSPKYDENRIKYTKITEIGGTTTKENLVVTPNRQYQTLPAPFYSTTEHSKVSSSTTGKPQPQKSSRGKTFVEIQKSVNVHNMLIREHNGKFVEQYEEYRNPYRYGQKVIKIDTQPQEITETFSTRQPIIVSDEAKYLEPVTVSNPSHVLPVPYPVDTHIKEHIPVVKKVPVYISTPAPYPVEKRIKEYIPVWKKVPVYISTPAPYPVEKQIKEYIPVEKKIPVYVSTPTPYPVEIPKPYPVEKIVEKPITVTQNIPFYINRPYPVETIVEKQVQVPVEKIVEKYVDRPYPYPVEVTVEKIVEKKVPVHEFIKVPYAVKVPEYIPQPYPVEKIVEKIIDRPVEKIKVVEKEVKVPYPVVIKKIVEKPVDKYIDRPYAVPIPVGVPVDRRYPVETIIPVQKVVEKPVQVEVEKIVEKPTRVEVEKIVDRPITVEKVVEKIVDRPVTVERIINRAILIPVQVPVPYPIPTAPTYQSHDFHPHKGNYFGKSNALHTDFNLPIISNHYPTTELYTLLQPTPPHQSALNFYNQPPGLPVSGQQSSPVSVTLLPKRPTYLFPSKYSHSSNPIINNIRYAKNFNYKPSLPHAILQHSLHKVIANDYIGPVPAESEKSFWVVAPGPGSRGLYKRSSDFEKNLRVEYGFKPPLVPSVEIDDQGQPIERKD